MNNFIRITISILLASSSLSMQSVFAADGAFPKVVAALTGSPPEGFAIGRGTNANNASVDGSIYKADLRSGEGAVLVDVVEPWTEATCRLLGIRVDPRTNNLFGAGCFFGNAFVYDAKNGDKLMEYQLNQSPEFGIINDLTITKDAVYFTDSFRPVLYRLPLSKKGAFPLDAGAATEIALPAEFLNTDGFCCAGNGIVATRNGKYLIVGHSNLARLYRVDTKTGAVDQIVMDQPLTGFLDGIAMRGKKVYIMTPYDFPGPPDSLDRIQVVKLDIRGLKGKLVETITDPEHLDGVASGAIFGRPLYVNNARYSTFPMPDTAYSLTKLKLKSKKD